MSGSDDESIETLKRKVKALQESAAALKASATAAESLKKGKPSAKVEPFPSVAETACKVKNKQGALVFNAAKMLIAFEGVGCSAQELEDYRKFFKDHMSDKWVMSKNGEPEPFQKQKSVLKTEEQELFGPGGHLERLANNKFIVNYWSQIITQSKRTFSVRKIKMAKKEQDPELDVSASALGRRPRGGEVAFFDLTGESEEDAPNELTAAEATKESKGNALKNSNIKQEKEKKRKQTKDDGAKKKKKKANEDAGNGKEDADGDKKKKKKESEQDGDGKAPSAGRQRSQRHK